MKYTLMYDRRVYNQILTGMTGILTGMTGILTGMTGILTCITYVSIG